MRILGFKKEDTAANIAGLSGSYVPGGWYRETDTGEVKYAVDANTLSAKLQWGSAAADAVQTNLTNYINSNDAALAQEIQDRIDGDAALQTAVDAKAATSYVNTQLATKVAQTAYDTKMAALDAADATHTTDIATNASGLADEITRATAAEGVNAAAISAETTRATTAESGLQTAINTEKGRIDAILAGAGADTDTFAELVTLVNSIDTENDNAFASYVLSNNAALAQEIQDRIDADTALQLDIDSRALDSNVVHLTGDESISGVKTFTDDMVFSDERKTILFGDESATYGKYGADLITIKGVSSQTEISDSAVYSSRGFFNQSISVKDVDNGTLYFLQVKGGEFYVSATELV